MVKVLRVCAVMCILCGRYVSGNDPCLAHNYKAIDEADRSIQHISETHVCDVNTFESQFWYRVTGEAGNALTVIAPEKNACGTILRAYLIEDHPTSNEGEVIRKVCLTGPNGYDDVDGSGGNSGGRGTGGSATSSVGSGNDSVDGSGESVGSAGDDANENGRGDRIDGDGSAGRKGHGSRGNGGGESSGGGDGSAHDESGNGGPKGSGRVSSYGSGGGSFSSPGGSGSSGSGRSAPSESSRHSSDFQGEEGSDGSDRGGSSRGSGEGSVESGLSESDKGDNGGNGRDSPYRSGEGDPGESGVGRSGGRSVGGAGGNGEGGSGEGGSVEGGSGEGGSGGGRRDSISITGGRSSSGGDESVSDGSGEGDSGGNGRGSSGGGSRDSTSRRGWGTGGGRRADSAVSGEDESGESPKSGSGEGNSGRSGDSGFGESDGRSSDGGSVGDAMVRGDVDSSERDESSSGESDSSGRGRGGSGSGDRGGSVEGRSDEGDGGSPGRDDHSGRGGGDSSRSVAGGGGEGRSVEADSSGIAEEEGNSNGSREGASGESKYIGEGESEASEGEGGPDDRSQSDSSSSGEDNASGRGTREGNSRCRGVSEGDPSGSSAGGSGEGDPSVGGGEGGSSGSGEGGSSEGGTGGGDSSGSGGDGSREVYSRGCGGRSRRRSVSGHGRGRSRRRRSNESSDDCSRFTFIKVRNCGTFYVYKLRPILPKCGINPWRYCTNGIKGNPCELYPCGKDERCEISSNGENRTCEVVDGKWGSWLTWNNCDKPCNTGYRRRRRRCDNPAPKPHGKYCEGLALEKIECNTENCAPDELNYRVRFPSEEWSDDLAHPGSSRYTSLINKIIQECENLYSREQKENVTTEVVEFKKGSVIANFNISYYAIDSLQIVLIQEELIGGSLGQMTAQLMNISSNKGCKELKNLLITTFYNLLLPLNRNADNMNQVPNEAPVILLSQSRSSTVLYLKWSLIEKTNGYPVLGYAVVYKEVGQKFKADQLKSVSEATQETVLDELKKFTKYSIRVFAFNKNGNGISSDPVSLTTQEDIPSQPPPNNNIQSTSSSTIDVSWQPISEAYVHGILLGYHIKYGKADEIPVSWNTIRVGPNITEYRLKDLLYFTRYEVEICALTVKGCGVTNAATVHTFGSVPNKPPQHLTVTNQTSESSIHLNWNPVPVDHVNGLLTGYDVSYQKIQTADKPVHHTKEHVITVTPEELSVTIPPPGNQPLQTYSLYRIRVAARTQKGRGPYTEYVYAETCRCPKTLYTNYWSNSPYLKLDDDRKLEGIFGKVVTEMVHTACGFCDGHGETVIELETNGKGGNAAKKTALEVLRDIDDVPQLSFPIYGNKYITKYMGGYAYINLVASPGVAFIAVTKPPGKVAMNMINAIWSCMPVVILSACMAYIAGFIIWMLDTRSNPENFPNSFRKGIGEGFWWSFISMTTVGYGDRSPVSIPAKVFAIMWTLTGLVIISILVGAIASSLTNEMVEKELTLYGAKIGAVQNSTEYRIGILKNAKVNEEREYGNVDELRMALNGREIQGALLDTYVAAENKETLFDDNMMVKDILDWPFGYGIVLSGDAVNVEHRCRDYIDMKISEISRTIQELTHTLEAPAVDADVEKSTDLFDPSSNMFKTAILFLTGLLSLSVILGLAYQRMLYIPGQQKVSTVAQCAYKNHLLGEMKELVDTFHCQLIEKITLLVQRQKNERQKLRKFIKADKLSQTKDLCFVARMNVYNSEEEFPTLESNLHNHYKIDRLDSVRSMEALSWDAPVASPRNLRANDLKRYPTRSSTSETESGIHTKDVLCDGFLY